ncbi:MAG TPA: hypothetical protein VNA20_15190 [Frankiaceae bacterium]|nr:hypothetical protein [Frankiaceae bacterium]
MKSRKLTLRAEHLAELTTADLSSVAGASGLPCDTLDVTWICPTYGCTGQWPTFNGCTTDCLD